MKENIKLYINDFVKIHITNIRDMITTDRKLIDDLLANVEHLINITLPNLRTELLNLINALNNELETLKLQIQNDFNATKESIDDGMNNHINNYNNPHTVTAAQLGTYTAAQIQAKINAWVATLTADRTPH
jgi:hypothetical protein